MVSPERYAELKQRVYVMRNGVTADSLRSAGCPYRLIFGLNLPQLTEIAAEYGPDPEMARELRLHSDLRENVLLAPMLFPPEALTFDEALDWVNECRWAEDADILCFKLLRRVPFAAELADALCASDRPLDRYTGLRLHLGILPQAAPEALAAADAELARPDSPNRSLAALLRGEAEFLIENP